MQTMRSDNIRECEVNELENKSQIGCSQEHCTHDSYIVKYLLFQKFMLRQ